MHLCSFLPILSFLFSLVTAIPSTELNARYQPPVNQTTCDGKRYTYNGLVGYGFIPSDARDKFGDTIGGIGSSIAVDPKAWRQTGKNTYKGIVWTLPDRGWNTEGTVNFQNRVHKIAFTLTLKPNASPSNPSKPNLELEYLDTVLFTGPDGTPTTGLDADIKGSIQFPGFPRMPVATYTGDGFGGPGPGGKRIAIDSEGLVLNRDGSFWVSDEYGPFIYKFSPRGRMQAAIRPPPAYIPRRNGTVSFSADSPPIYDLGEVIIPADTETGRDNNQGLEGLTLSSDGSTLFALMQSALDQEGGPKNPSRKQARLLEYDISGPSPKYTNEYVVTLPLYIPDGSNSSKVAAQSEIHYISATQFLILARDSSAGHGQADSLSVYRDADVFSIASATDIKSPVYDSVNGSIASSKGVLDAGITAAEYCPFLDFNVNSELGKFGLHNGGAQDQFLLNEKWESLALLPQYGNGKGKDYFLFSFSDNDFITQNGFLNFGTYLYKDSSGFNLDNQALVFSVTLP